MEKEFYSIAEVAEKLSISIKSVRRHIAANELIAAKTGNVYRINASDLSDFIELQHSGEKAEKQIHNIIESLNVAPDVQPVLLRYDEEVHGLPLVAAEDMPEYSPRIKSDMMLVGCYKDKRHKEWIEKNGLYNIRLGRRNGSIEKSSLMIAASRLLLYDKDHPSEYKVYQLVVTKQVLASPQTMQEKNYPGTKGSRSYILYFMGDEVEKHPLYDVTKLRVKFAPNTKNNLPFFVEL